MYRNDRSLLEETRWLGFWLISVCLETRWLVQSVLRNTLAGSKIVVSICRTPSVVIDLNITHDRHGRSTSNPHTNGNLTDPDCLDKPLEITTISKVTKHQAAYIKNNSTSCMPGVASTSGRLCCELLRPLFLQAYRKTEKYCRLFGLLKRAAFYSGIRGKWVSSSRRLLPCAPTSTLTAAWSTWAAHTSHTARTLLASSPPPCLITFSLSVPVIKCPAWGHLIQSPLALAP